MSQLKSFKEEISSVKSSLSSVKGKNVFMVLYNYSDFDYSIIKIMETLDDAYKYICHNEDSNCLECKLITVSNPNEILKEIQSDCLNICYILSGKYNKFNLCGINFGEISNYAIIPMVIS